MTADYLSRIPATSETPPIIAAFDQFQPGLQELQLKDENVELMKISRTRDFGWNILLSSK